MAKRFGEALNEQEVSKRIKNAVPKTTQYKTQWGIRIFECCKSEITDDYGSAESCNFGLDVSVVESLKRPK
jgi:hypothetical protein